MERSGEVETVAGYQRSGLGIEPLPWEESVE